MTNYTLVITSCNRHDLLQQTLESFLNTTDVPPTETLIYEDSSTPRPMWLDSSIIWLSAGPRRGQAVAIDSLYERANTEYIFHCEDDWGFVETGFLSKSHEILEQFSRIYAVTLRRDWNPPLVEETDFPGLQIAMPYWGGCWGGCSWNPGLRRRSDWVKYGGYQKFSDEATLSKHLLNEGYRMATIPRHCIHLGEGRHVA